MNLEEAIVVVKPKINIDIFQGLLEYTEHKAKEKMTTTGGLNENVRNVVGYTLGKDKISDIVYFKHIQNIITQNYIFYKIKFPHVQTSKINQIDLLKYEKNGKYEIHTDHAYQTPRTLTCIINLSENYEGGDFIFYKQNSKEEMKRVKCEKGTMIFFPSNFLYPHKIEPITEGTRYSIVSWLT